MIPTPSTPLAASAHGSAGRTHWVYRRRTSPATANANGTIKSVNPTKMVGGWIAFQGFWSRSLSPCPSAGTKPATWSIGASGNLSVSVTNGLAPTGSGPSRSPAIIESRNAWHSATTASTGPASTRRASRTGAPPSVRSDHRTSSPPTMVVIRIHSRNDPSWPAQNAENV